MSSDSESERSSSPRAFDDESIAESSSSKLRSEDFEPTGSDLVEGAEDLGTYSPTINVESDPPSSLGRGIKIVEVLIADPRQGVLSVVQGRERILMVKPKEIVFGVNHLKPKVLTESELAAIPAEYHISESVVMQILGPFESLSNPDSEVIFFTYAFTHGLRLRFRRCLQRLVMLRG